MGPRKRKQRGIGKTALLHKSTLLLAPFAPDMQPDSSEYNCTM